ncbi:MAG TPA: universal stress protein [Gaiellales bacterium]|nr:universal stress protein [Gaiellales bacterium]
MTADGSEQARPIVVALDDSHAAVQAVRWAAGQARLTGAALRLVHAWERPLSWADSSDRARTTAALVRLPHDSAPAEPDRTQTLATLEGALAQALAGATGGREISLEAIRGPAATVLTDAAETASLLVVDSQHQTRFAAGVLGSVSHHCAVQAGCPVVVVPVHVEFSPPG